MNPAGLLFGPGARLEVGGSFHATTADYLRLIDHHRFEARPIALPGLMVPAKYA